MSRNEMDPPLCGSTARSYWIPGSYAPTWSEKRTSLCKAIEKEGLQGGQGDNNWVGRHRQIHDPGIQQEPRKIGSKTARKGSVPQPVLTRYTLLYMARHACDNSFEA